MFYEILYIYKKKKILKSLDQQKIYKINWNFFNGNESKQTDT